MVVCAKGSDDLTLQQKPTEEVKGLAADPVRGTYWVYTDQSLFELGVGNDDRDVWKVFMKQGHFDVALRYVKVRSNIPRIHDSRS